MGRTIPEKFLEAAEKFSAKKALLHKESGRYVSVSYGELLRQVRQAAAAFRELGIGPGDKVAIMSEGRPEWAIADLAALWLGAVTVPVHTTLSARTVGHILDHSEAKALVFSQKEFLEKFSQAELSSLGNCVFMGQIDKEMSDRCRGLHSWNEFMHRGGEGLSQPAKASPDDLASIIYTSGTTGLPKGVMLTHGNLVSNVEMTAKAVPVGERDVFLSFLPLSHVLERMAGYYIPLFQGATIAYAEGVKELAHNLREVRPTILIAVPRIFEKFSDAIWDNVRNSSESKKKIFYWSLKQRKGFGRFLANALVFGKIRRKMGGRLRLAVSGGAPLDEKIGKFFDKMGIRILEGYGLTETSPVVAVNRMDKCKFGTVGQPLEGLEVRISADKEILVKGPNVMRGYFKNDMETDQMIDDDGWLHSGDYGFLDSDGFLIVVGRKKEMMVTSGGKNIWPEHIEQGLNFDKLIAQSLIVGHKRNFVSALIVPDHRELYLYVKENGLPEKPPEELIRDKAVIELYGKAVDNANRHLAEYEKVRKFTLLRREFSAELDEITPTLKVVRNKIESHFKEEIEGMYR